LCEGVQEGEESVFSTLTGRGRQEGEDGVACRRSPQGRDTGAKESLVDMKGVPTVFCRILKGSTGKGEKGEGAFGRSPIPFLNGGDPQDKKVSGVERTGIKTMQETLQRGEGK